MIIRGDSEFQISLASRLADSLDVATGKRPIIDVFTNVETDGKFCLFLPELDIEKPLLSSLTPIEFNALQKLLTNVRGILWVVRGAYTHSCNPKANMVTGLSRSIRSETLLKFATLDLDHESQPSEERAFRAILHVFETTFFGPNAESDCDLEFMERNGKIFIPRIINDDEMNEYVHKQTKPNVLEPTPFAQDGRALRLTVGKPGILETLHFSDQSMDDPLAHDAVEIEVKAIAMNEGDLDTAMGRVENSHLGLECSGIVMNVGCNVTEFAAGDHVAGISISNGAFSTYARIEAASAFKVNKEMSFEDASSIPVAYSKAKYGLIDLGRLLEGEKVLITGATSATGQAAIELARLSGADTFATVSSIESKQLLMKRYDIPEDHIISGQVTSSGASVRRAYGSGNFDLVFNCVPTDADTLREIWNCLSNFGRFVDVANQDTSTRLEISHHGNNKSYMSIDLIAMANEKRQKIDRLLADVSELLEMSKIKPISTTVFPMSEVVAAFKSLQQGNVTGKLVVVPQPGDVVKVRSLRSIH